MVEIPSTMWTVRFCPHKKVRTQNHIRKIYALDLRCKCVQLMRIRKYEVFVITAEKRKRFCTHAKTDESG